jgi:hypothetical protein
MISKLSSQFFQNLDHDKKVNDVWYESFVLKYPGIINRSKKDNTRLTAIQMSAEGAKIAVYVDKNDKTKESYFHYVVDKDNCKIAIYVTNLTPNNVSYSGRLNFHMFKGLNKDNMKPEYNMGLNDITSLGPNDTFKIEFDQCHNNEAIILSTIENIVNGKDVGITVKEDREAVEKKEVDAPRGLFMFPVIKPQQDVKPLCDLFEETIWEAESSFSRIKDPQDIPWSSRGLIPKGRSRGPVSIGAPAYPISLLGYEQQMNLLGDRQRSFIPSQSMGMGGMGMGIVSAMGMGMNMSDILRGPRSLQSKSVTTNTANIDSESDGCSSVRMDDTEGAEEESVVQQSDHRASGKHRDAVGKRKSSKKKSKSKSKVQKTSGERDVTEEAKICQMKYGEQMKPSDFEVDDTVYDDDKLSAPCLIQCSVFDNGSLDIPSFESNFEKLKTVYKEKADADIDNLDKKKYYDKIVYDPVENCVSCFESLEIGKRRLYMACGHTVQCQDCDDKYRDTAQGCTCPVCRTAVEYRRLY